ncbi:MAG: hypothetical protein WKG03_02545 [Telluria sp.]
MEMEYMKTVWIDSHAVKGHEHLVDGERLAADTQRALNELESSGYDLVSLTPIVSGRYGHARFDGRVTTGFFKKPTIAPDTCASWGYSMTDGVMIVAREKK